MAELKKIHEAILKGDLQTSVNITKEALEEGTDPQSIIRGYMIPAMDKIGTKFEKNECFVPELLIAARAMKGSLELLRPLLAKADAKPEGKVIIGTVKGDLHDIGKNIAGMIFESAGYEVVDLGKDVSCKKIIKAIKKYKPDAIGLSALLTTTMSEMENVISALRKEKLDVKVIIGGPNVNMDYAKKIGAFGAARNVIEGLRILKTIK